MLMAASEGVVFTGPVVATPPMLNGGEWHAGRPRRSELIEQYGGRLVLEAVADYCFRT